LKYFMLDVWDVFLVFLQHQCNLSHIMNFLL